MSYLAVSIGQEFGQNIITGFFENVQSRSQTALGSHLEAKLVQGLLLSSLRVNEWQNLHLAIVGLRYLLSSWLLAGGCPQLLKTTQQFPVKWASPRCHLVIKPARRISRASLTARQVLYNIMNTQEWQPINFVIVYWLEASHRSHPHSKRGATQGHEHKEVGTMRGYLSICLP